MNRLSRSMGFTGQLPLALLCLLGLLLCALAGRWASAAETPHQPGRLIGHELIKSFEAADFERVRNAELDDFFHMATMKASDFRSRLASSYRKVALHRVAYESQVPEFGNQKVVAYGLVAIPEGAAHGAPVLSYQHGTVFGKEEAPSNIEKSMETKLALLQ